MKVIKSLAIIGLSLFIGVPSYADTPRNKQPIKKTQTAQKAKQVQSKKTQSTKKKVDPNAKKLNSSGSSSTVNKAAAPNAVEQKKVEQPKNFVDTVIKINFYSMRVVQEAEPMIYFDYELENKTLMPITQIHWESRYRYLEQNMMTHNIPISIPNNVLQPNVAQGFSFPIPWEQLPENAKQILANPQGAISAEFVVKSVVFSDGTKIHFEYQ